MNSIGRQAFFFAITLLFLGKVQAGAPPSYQVRIGKFESRALWTPVLLPDQAPKAPAVILIPGSGPNGPEEMMPPSLTADGKSHSLFGEMSRPLNSKGVHTLAVGKPGVEFFTSWDPSRIFYDRELYTRLRWADLITNLHEAVKFLREQPSVDPSRIYVLGHSEGTQVAVDYAATNTDIAGIILLGYAGEDLGTILDWQFYKRDIEFFVATDVDTNHDGLVTKNEAAHWPEFQWDWQVGQNEVSFQDIESKLRADPELTEAYAAARNRPLWNTIFNRGPIYDFTAGLKQDVYVFTGALDIQTPSTQARTLAGTCGRVRKANCFVEIIPGLGHGFSEPKGPRGQPLLDSTLGPVDARFQAILSQLAEKFRN